MPTPALLRLPGSASPRGAEPGVILWVGVLVLLLACAAHADYPADRAAAVGLVAAGKDAEALSAFLKMAETAASDVQKSDALDQAAMCAHRLKDEARAKDLAGRIPLGPASKTCRMRLLAEARDWPEIVAASKDDDLDAWPEYLSAEAHFLRGTAFAAAKDGARAVADLERAGRTLTEENALGLALCALGDACRDLLKDDARALDAYRKVYRTRNVYKQCQAAMGAASILTRQGRHEDALAELGRVDLAAVVIPYWRCALLGAYGGALAAQGKKDEAAARYREALRVPGILPAQRAAFDKALQDLAPAPRTQ